MFTAGRYLLTEQFRLNEQDLLALFERHGYDLVLLEGFGDSGWAKIEVVRSSVSPVGTAFQPMAIVGDVPGADFALLLWQTGSRTRWRPCNGGSA